MTASVDHSDALIRIHYHMCGCMMSSHIHKLLGILCSSLSLQHPFISQDAHSPSWHTAALAGMHIAHQVVVHSVSGAVLSTLLSGLCSASVQQTLMDRLSAQVEGHDMVDSSNTAELHLRTVLTVQEAAVQATQRALQDCKAAGRAEGPVSQGQARFTLGCSGPRSYGRELHRCRLCCSCS